MVVDAHAHVFAPVSGRFPRDVHDLFPADLAASAEELLHAMTQAGVDRAVLVPLSAHDEYLRSSVGQHPGRFATIGVQPAGPADVEAYRARRASVGLQGVRVFELGTPPARQAEELESFPLLAELERSGDKLWFYGGRDQMELLELALGALPELTVVLNHLGYWPSELHPDGAGRPRFSGRYTEEGLAFVTRLARFPNVSILFAGLYAFAEEPCPYQDLRPVTTALLDAYGPRRLLLGSDFPWIRADPGYTESIEALDHHFGDLPESDRALIRGGNALALFDF